MVKRLQPLGSILEGIFQELGIQKELILYRLTTHWEEVVGPQVASHTTPHLLRFRTLTLGVDSAPWMNQLFFFKKEIIEKTNRFLEKPLIDEIYFKRISLPLPRKVSLKQKQADPLPPLAPEQENALHESIDALHDAELHKSIREALSRYFQA